MVRYYIVCAVMWWNSGRRYFQQDLEALLPHLTVTLEYSAGFHAENRTAE